MRFLSRLIFVTTFSLFPSAHAAYQPPASQVVQGYLRHPLTTIFVRSKDSAREYPLNQMVVAVQINGHPTSLIVDSGGSTLGISPEFCRALGVNPMPELFRFQRGAINGQRVARLHARTLTIGGQQYRNVPGVSAAGVAINVKSGTAAGFNVTGLLGADFLHAHRAIIDCGRGGLFLPSDPKVKSITSGLAAQGWTAIPLKVIGHDYLSVAATINGYRGRFFIDTGAATILVNRKSADRAKVKGTARRVKLSGIKISDPSGEISKLDRLSIGHYRIDNEFVIVSSRWEKTLESLGGSGPCLGLLGLSFLSTHGAVIDYRTKTLYLKPPTAIAKKH